MKALAFAVLMLCASAATADEFGLRFGGQEPAALAQTEEETEALQAIEPAGGEDATEPEKEPSVSAAISPEKAGTGAKFGPERPPEQ